MMQLLIALAISVAPTPAIVADPSGLDPIVAEIVRGPNFLPVGRGDLRNAAFRGEGRTLIFEADVVPEMANVVGAQAVAHAMATGICADRRRGRFFSEGRTLRVELRNAGHPPSIASIDRCDGPTGTGLSAAALANALQPMAGREIDGVTITSIRSEGDLVVISLDGAAGWRHGQSPETFDNAFLGNFCDLPGGQNPYFNGTRKIRIDSFENGRALVQGRLISSCPAR